MAKLRLPKLRHRKKGEKWFWETKTIKVYSRTVKFALGSLGAGLLFTVFGIASGVDIAGLSIPTILVVIGFIALLIDALK